MLAGWASLVAIRSSAMGGLSSTAETLYALDMLRSSVKGNNVFSCI